uniref:DUF218 domain-containing protein n=1 Tax=Labrus bergylta TaxID=56723 RepID=A0A3Q3E7Y3_9LABR
MDEECEERARILWDYLCLHQRLEKVWTVMLRIYLFLNSIGQFVFSIGVWTRPEAEVFLDVALRMGVPRMNSLLETEATNTGENIRFSHRVLKERNIPVSKVILVQQPFMERRVYATFMCQWPSNFDYSHPTVGTASDLICYMLSTVYHLFFSAMLGVREMDWLGWLLPQVNNSHSGAMTAGIS